MQTTPTNSGIEGLAWSPNDRTFWFFKERNPIEIYTVKGLLRNDDLTIGHDVTLQNNLDVKDISGAEFNAQKKSLLILSHESQVLKEVTTAGKPLARCLSPAAVTDWQKRFARRKASRWTIAGRSLSSRSLISFTVSRLAQNNNSATRFSPFVINLLLLAFSHTE